MSLYTTIIDHIDRLALNKVPIRASYYNTHCVIYTLANPPRIMRIDYKTVERALANIESMNICNLCSVETGAQISCFECGNSYCTMCFVKMICINYSLGNYKCPYCKYINMFSNNKHMLESVFLALQHFNLNYDDIISIITRVIKESPNLLKTDGIE